MTYLVTVLVMVALYGAIAVLYRRQHFAPKVTGSTDADSVKNAETLPSPVKEMRMLSATKQVIDAYHRAAIARAIERNKALEPPNEEIARMLLLYWMQSEQSDSQKSDWITWETSRHVEGRATPQRRAFFGYRFTKPDDLLDESGQETPTTARARSH